MNKLLFKYLILLCLAIIGNRAYAQYAGAKYEKGPSGMEILQVDNRELSTMIYIAYTPPEFADGDVFAACYRDKTFIQVEGSSKQYHMISAINMPIASEAVYRAMVFEKNNQRHQFILEFEKIPEGKSFDIIENASNPKAFNFYGVTYTPTDSSTFVNIDRFIADYPVKEMGRYIVKGSWIAYVKARDIVVSIKPSVIKQYGKYYNFDICVQNFSNKSILFNPDNIRVEGLSYNEDESYIYKEDEGFIYNNTRKPQQVELQMLTYDQYDRIVKRKQNWNNFFVGFAGALATYNAGVSTSTTTYSGGAYTIGSAHASGRIGNSYGYANTYGSSYTSTYGQSTTRTYDAAAAYAVRRKANEDYANYANSQSQIRQQLADGYVKMNTIPPGTDYSGYFNVKYKKVKSYVLKIVIDGEVYSFSYRCD